MKQYRMIISRSHVGTVLACFWASTLARAGDWPGWRGPERTGVSRETGLLKQWPPEGPKLLWKITGIGSGYSTPSVCGGRLFVMGSEGAEEFLISLDVKDGHVLWSTRVGQVGENRGPNYPGPRSTPTVDGATVYTLGSDGDLLAAGALTGKILWHRNLEKDFAGKRGTWAYTESVLIDGDALVCTPGGNKATMLALDKRTGAVRWQMAKAEYNTAGYASAIVAEVGGVRQYIQFLGSGLIGVAADNGKPLWFYNKHIGGISAAAPIFHNGCVFSTAEGGDDAGGDALLRLNTDGKGVHARQLYLVRAMMNHHGGAVRIGDYLYGTGSQALVCMDFKTGVRKWRERSVGPGSVAGADGLLYVRGVQGQVALVEANPNGYLERGRFRQPSRSRFPTFCHPVIADARLYLRDDDVILCYDLKEREAAGK
jgi:outer membrane protein assembly factor BamB